MFFYSKHVCNSDHRQRDRFIIENRFRSISLFLPPLSRHFRLFLRVFFIVFRLSVFTCAVNEPPGSTSDGPRGDAGKFQNGAEEHSCGITIILRHFRVKSVWRKIREHEYAAAQCMCACSINVESYCETYCAWRQKSVFRRGRRQKQKKKKPKQYTTTNWYPSA